MSVKDFPEGVALVIGGSGGVGAASCLKLAAAGSDIVLTYHSNQARAEEVAEQVNNSGRVAETHQLSIGDAPRVERVINDVASRHRIHTVVIAAGSDIPQKMLRDISPQQWRDVIDADVNGFFNICHYALPPMKSAGGGSFVHISSAGLHKWPERDGLSVAPKAAIEWLLQGLAKEEGAYGIRANSVAIGVIETGIFLRLWQDGSFDEAWREAVQSELCLKRWGKPEEVAEAVLYLASNRSAYVTGQMISVDGGYGV